MGASGFLFNGFCLMVSILFIVVLGGGFYGWFFGRSVFGGGDRKSVV